MLPKETELTITALHLAKVQPPATPVCWFTLTRSAFNYTRKQVLRSLLHRFLIRLLGVILHGHNWLLFYTAAKSSEGHRVGVTDKLTLTNQIWRSFSSAFFPPIPLRVSQDLKVTAVGMVLCGSHILHINTACHQAPGPAVASGGDFFSTVTAPQCLVWKTFFPAA